MFSGIVCCLIFVIDEGNVQCQGASIKVNYLNEFKLTEMFLKIEPKNTQPLLEATTKVVQEYAKIIPEEDKRIAENSVHMMHKIGKRLTKFWKQLTDWHSTRIQLLSIMKNDSEAIFNVTIDTFNTIHNDFDYEIRYKLYFDLLYWEKRVGFIYMNDNLLKAFNITKTYRKNIKALRGLQEAKRIEKKLNRFYPKFKKLQKLLGWIVNNIQQLKIPRIDGTNNCNKQSEGVNLIRTDDGASFLAVCDSEWLVVAQRFDGSVDFHDPQEEQKEYSVPFGDPPSEYFIGLDNLASAAAQDVYMLRIELTTWKNETRTADYFKFDVTPLDYVDWDLQYRPSWYTLRLGEYKGSAGNSLYKKGQYSDKIYPINPNGWWWGCCGKANLFGRYNNGPKCEKEMDCMSWKAWPEKLLEGKDNGFYSFKAMRIMIGPLPIELPSDVPCIEQKPGINNIQLPNGGSFKAQCEENWLLVAHRFDGSVDFYRTWAEYKAGFGDPPGEYFIGLDNLAALISENNRKRYVLKLEFTTWSGQTETAEYYIFQMPAYDNGNTGVRIADFRGSGRDVMTDYHYYHYDYGYIDNPFTTWDHGNEMYKYGPKCSVLRRGAWWYYQPHGTADDIYEEANIDYEDRDYCGVVNPFGQYVNGTKCDIKFGCMSWMGWPGELFSDAERKENKELNNAWYSFKEMKFLIRPREPNWSYNYYFDETF
ncbi:unnamed protein product [Owenia fusiformis]|uniref:Uncharacterized protein n=1 Tax=Owenia fusiformis TaxID=6347 RepID=A0A8J1T514_OWEFU|nr:unnamed protein product [Owenia fusiformis]